MQSLSNLVEWVFVVELGIRVFNAIPGALMEQNLSVWTAHTGRL